MSTQNKEWVRNPRILEINTLPWLNKLSEKYNSALTLGNVPTAVLNEITRYYDAIWLMGVWERSPASKKIASERSDLQREFQKALTDLRDEDVVGSPYSIFYYHVDKNIGGVEGLKNFREKLSNHNIRLILDYVPNHVSIDSLWTFEPEIFIRGTLEDLMSKPYEYFSIGEKIFAYGRDPNFAPWTDVIQINAFSQKARLKTIDALSNLAELCDGVRCDMAMLVTNEIFNKTWGVKAGSIPDKEFWEEIIPSIKKKYPHFLFIAEVYWDMEWELQQQGFNFCYDKRLYDRLANQSAETIVDHLQADWTYQRRLIRFIENHDEVRAVKKFGEEKSLAAAIIAFTLPGARLINEGQTNGYKIKLPVQLGRYPNELVNENVMEFYQKLLSSIPDREFENGSWSLCKTERVNSNESSYSDVIAYLWWVNGEFRLIVVNYSSKMTKAHVRIKPFNFDASNKWDFIDLLTNKIYTYKGQDLFKYGLYVELNGWKGHIFDIRKSK
ncbi:MAG: alpha-amylase family glycosyl hydrolase [Candidatus Thorarchaeota archaeon]